MGTALGAGDTTGKKTTMPHLSMFYIMMGKI
jgi:hypothetical protein